MLIIMSYCGMTCSGFLWGEWVDLTLEMVTVQEVFSPKNCTKENPGANEKVLVFNLTIFSVKANVI